MVKMTSNFKSEKCMQIVLLPAKKYLHPFMTWNKIDYLVTYTFYVLCAKIDFVDSDHAILAVKISRPHYKKVVFFQNEYTIE